MYSEVKSFLEENFGKEYRGYRYLGFSSDEYQPIATALREFLFFRKAVGKVNSYFVTTSPIDTYSSNLCIRLELPSHEIEEFNFVCEEHPTLKERLQEFREREDKV